MGQQKYLTAIIVGVGSLLISITPVCVAQTRCVSALISSCICASSSASGWMVRPGTIGDAMTKPDGSLVYLDAVVIDKIRAKQSPGYVVVYEPFSPKDRLIVLTQPAPELRLGQTVDVEGTMTTLRNGYRAVINPTIYGYLDKEGRLMLRGGTIKGFIAPTPWPWKTDLTVEAAATQSPADGASVEPDSAPDDDPTYCPTISDIFEACAAAQTASARSGGIRVQAYYEHISELDGLGDGALVELQCKGILAADTETIDSIEYKYVDIADDPPAGSIRAYYAKAVDVSASDRVNLITGQIQHVDATPVICVDTGPRYDTEIPEGRLVTASPGSIAYALTQVDGAWATLDDKVVTANQTDFPSALYVQEPDRAGGIRVLFSGSLSHEPIRGDTISVTGTIGTGADVEREIDADTITYVDHPGEPKPLGMPNRLLGGSDFNVYTPGVNWPDGSGVGLYNKGLLVKIWGKVTFVDLTNKCFYVDDGTGFDDGSSHIGVKVSWNWPTSGKPSILPPLQDWYVSVTGISGSEDFGSGRIIRTLRPRDQSDIVVHKAGTPIVYDPVESWQEEFTPSDSFDSGGTGPSSADSVDVATGAYNNDPDPDIVVTNPSGPDGAFIRIYRSKLAEAGTASAGLSVGWAHGYDVRIVREEAGWGDMKVLFPDGAADTLRPVIDGGTPTGAFTPMGPSYLATGEASGTPGLWNWIRITFPDETRWEFTSASGSPYRLTKVSDIRGNSIYVNRNLDTSISSVSTDQAGLNKLLDFSYSTGSLTITDVSSSRTVTLSFVMEAGATVLKSVSQVSPSAGLRWRYTYEQVGGRPYLVQVEVPDPADPTGSSYRGHPIIYDSEGRVQEIKDANLNSHSYVYGQVGGQGRTQVFVKDPDGRVVECWAHKIGTNKEDLGVIDANGEETGIEYNAAKRPWRFTNKNNKQTTVVYDDYGNATQVTDEANLTTVYGYTDTGSPFRVTSAQTASKTSTTFDYDANGMLWHVNSPKPGTSGTGERVTTTYTYTSLGNVETIITPPGLGTDSNPDIREVTTTVYEYDQDTDYSYSTTEKLGQPIVISVYQGDPANGKLLTRTHLRYDSRGRLIEVADPLIGNPPDPSDYYLRHRTTLAYNNEDQITDIWYAPTGTDVDERTHRHYTYNYPGGELTTIELYSETDPVNPFRTIEATSGNESEIKDVLGDTLKISHAYDALYRLKEVTDINNHATSFGYDAVGNVSSMRYPGGQLYQWGYDPDHNLDWRSDALNRTTNYGYDSTKSYLTSIDYPTGTDVSLTYDGYGRLQSMTDATGMVTYTYDDNDLVMTVTTDYTGNVPSKTISYAYNPDGSRRSMAVDGVSAAFNYWYSYSASPGPGLMVTVSNPGIGTPVRCYYNLKGQVIRQTQPRLLTDYTYDTRGLRSSVYNWATLPSPDVPASRFYNMQYDPAGNLLQASITIPAVGSAVARSGVVYYEYNDNKDRLTRERRTISGGADLYDVWFDYDDADNATQVRDLYFPTHNENNQIDQTGYVYNANGNATSYRGFGFDYDYEDLPASITGGRNGAISLAFRADGLRAWRETSTFGRDYFLYDGERVVCEFRDNGSTSCYYNYGPNGLAMRSSATTTYYVYSFDHLGSLVQPIYSGTDSGLGLKTVVHDAFGKLWWDQLASNGAQFSTPPDPVGFAGQWGAYTDHETRPSDQNTPLVLMGIRYYDPLTARFVTRDPTLGINDYAYCGNNPVGRVDPDGQILETIADIASIGWSTFDLIKNPSWANLGYLAWDVGATAVPFVPGSYTAKGAKIAAKATKAAAKTSKAAKGAKVAKAGSKGVKAARSAIEMHHLLPKQFKRQFVEAGLKIEDFKIPISKAGHRLKPGGLHTGPENWNKVWDEFFKKAGPRPSKKEILNQLEYMKGRFGIK